MTAVINPRPDRALGIGAVLTIIAAHVLLGIGGSFTRVIPSIHAVLTVAVALSVMLFSRRPERVIAVTVYGGVCDVYWRMTKSSAPWELSKYIFALGALVLVVRFVRRVPHGWVPMALLLTLIPGMLITAFSESFFFTRDNISGYEMGLVSLAFGAMAFRQVLGTRVDAWNLGWVSLGPLIAALGVTTHALLTNPDLGYSANSNTGSTGGFGPNQVSSTMGLITLICILLVFLPFARKLWWVLGGLGLWATWATFLTFSRGGIYSAVLAGAAMLLVGITQRGARVRSILVLAAVAVALVVVFSAADDFSGNWLGDRYEKAGSTGRDSIAEGDLGVFNRFPLSGVGTGRTMFFRTGTHGDLDTAAAHTEFTRLLAEHGILGLATIALLAVMLIQSYRWSLSYWNRLMIVALSVWSLTTMLHAATRIGAVSVMLALTQLRVSDKADTEPDEPAPRLSAMSPSPHAVDSSVTSAGTTP